MMLFLLLFFYDFKKVEIKEYACIFVWPITCILIVIKI